MLVSSKSLSTAIVGEMSCLLVSLLVSKCRYLTALTGSAGRSRGAVGYGGTAGGSRCYRTA